MQKGRLVTGPGEWRLTGECQTSILAGCFVPALPAACVACVRWRVGRSIRRSSNPPAATRVGFVFYPMLTRT